MIVISFGLIFMQSVNIKTGFVFSFKFDWHIFCNISWNLSQTFKPILPPDICQRDENNNVRRPCEFLPSLECHLVFSLSLTWLLRKLAPSYLSRESNCWKMNWWYYVKVDSFLENFAQSLAPLCHRHRCCWWCCYDEVNVLK